eukprot:1143183-Pelagomonas_calceolata.AAC.2
MKAPKRVSWGQRSSSAGIVGCGPAVSIVLRARSPCSSDAKRVGAGIMASCRPESLALYKAL